MFKTVTQQDVERLRRAVELITKLPSVQRSVIPFNGHVIGEGFNSETGERVSPGLDVREVGSDPIAGGQRADFSFHMLTSQRSFEKALNFGAELDARYAFASGGATLTEPHSTSPKAAPSI